jgi:hypothetical protein
MNKLFVPYDIAYSAYLKGFEDDCLGYYQNKELIINNLSKYSLDKHELGILAPIYQQLIDWFLSKKIYIRLYMIDCWCNWCYVVYVEDCMSPFAKTSTDEFTDHTECMNKALEAAFELI